MELLLDTHALLWFLADDEQLSATARQTICDSGAIIYVSVASAWEIAIKQKLGKLVFPEPLEETFAEGCDSSGFRLLSIELGHIAGTLALPFHHRDPFDRLLIAQAIEENLAFVSIDVRFDAYGIQRVW